jgi:hypothetical protein
MAVATVDLKRTATEVCLDPYIAAINRVTFLRTLASSLFIISLLFFLVPAVISFLWPWSLARMWRPGIVIYSLIVGLFIALIFPLTHLSDYSMSPAGVRLVLASIFPIWFGVRILIDGICLKEPTVKEQLLSTASPGWRGRARVLTAAFGIHPICSRIPNLARRMSARLLFILSGLVLGILISSTIILIAQGASILFLYLVMLTGSLVARLPRFFACRVARVSAEHLVRTDKRAPVLFLRSFQDDQVRLKWTGRGWFRGLLAIGEPKPTVDNVLLDEATSLGPVLAIGVPGAKPPFGVARTFVNDEQWQDAVEDLAKSARAIVVVLDETEGVQWELRHIKDSQWTTKTLYLLPPRFNPAAVSMRLLKRHVMHSEEAGAKRPVWVDQLAKPCIGWFWTADGRAVLLTCTTAGAAGYIAALRLFGAYQTDCYLPEGNEPELVQAADIQRFLKGINERFTTKRGIIVRSVDERVLAPVQGEYKLFSSEKEYREVTNDREPWIDPLTIGASSRATRFAPAT